MALLTRSKLLHSKLLNPTAASGSAFDPLTLSPWFWLRFQDVSTLFTTSGGSTNVSADSDPIGRAEDKSGNARHWTQATAGSRPLYRTSVVNGHAVARFDGSDDFWSGPNMSALTAGEIFIIIKIDADPPGADAQTGLWTIGTSGSSTHFPYTDGTVYDDFGANARQTTVNPTPSLTSFRLYNVKSTGTWTSFLDGTQIYTAGAIGVAFSASPKFGESSSSSYHLDGDCAEIIMFSSALGATDKDNLEAYFASRYSLTIA